MDTTYNKAVALAIPVFLALIFLELIADWIKGRKGGGSDPYYRLADSLNSLSCGILSTGARVFTGFVGLFVYEWILTHLAPVPLPAGHWGVWVFAFVLYDLCYYWNHRWGHTVGIFWASHVVHHQSEEFNLTTALRQSGTGTFLGWIFYIPLALCGVPLSVFLMVGVIQLFYQFWPHTRAIGRLGILDRWVQTPSNHRVHHAQNGIYLDKNYVGVFLLWDHLFGSYQEEREDEPCVYGIIGQLRSWNPVWANFHYYWAMSKDSWHAANWGDKVKVWFAHPGWRPADVAARFPKPEYDLQRDFVRFDAPRPAALSWYAFAQFVLLIAANSHFLSLLPGQAMAWNFAYFLYLLIGLVCVGGVLENQAVWIRAEAARVALVAAYVVGAAATGGPVWFGGTHSVTAAAAIGGAALLSLLWVSTAGYRMSPERLAAG